MTLSTSRMRTHVQNFDFRKLFIEELGWTNYRQFYSPLTLAAGGPTYQFTPIAEQGGMVVLQCTASDGELPTSAVRRKIHKHIRQLAAENFIIFVDGAKTIALWLWVKSESGKLTAREYTYRAGQTGDALLQRLAGIAFDINDLDEEGRVSIASVTDRVKDAFDVERVTKRFYDLFKDEHKAFLGFLQGIDATADQTWYASVMLNRLMFLYFLQSKAFLDNNTQYLRDKLAESQRRGPDQFYRGFLRTLFFEGLALDEASRDPATNRLLGRIPYLNGGLFMPHEIETRYGDQIEIADAAFERLFAFFGQYQWHLDDRPLRTGREINPDVLGYIFEKYINQKQMGAYYTKEDITGYICRNTILPFLLEKAGVDVGAALREIEPYIYESVSTEAYLPTETQREYAARRQRYQQILADHAAGKIATVNDLITYNLDIISFAQDWLQTLDDPARLHHFYFNGLAKLTVLDPTCGSGAFLFAALNILEPLYELALDRMTHFQQQRHIDAFAQELARVAAHPNRRYFVFKSIIVNNLYGVDIMAEAVEIARLRLFLKLVAEVDNVAKIEPLPDIDFNIRAGNTLVGFATREEIQRHLFAQTVLPKVVEADRAMAAFRALQVQLGIRPAQLAQAKAEVLGQMDAIRAALDHALMEDYGRSDLAEFQRTHQPFHWYIEFHHVLAEGGFDVIVGNPPYVEYAKTKDTYSIKGYATLASGNLYAYVIERSELLLSQNAFSGMIIPHSAFCTDRMAPLMQLFPPHTSKNSAWISSYDIRPAKLFVGVEQRLAIYVKRNADVNHQAVMSTKYTRWNEEFREALFETLQYGSLKGMVFKNSIPKIGAPVEARIWAKLSQKPALSTSLGGRTPVYFHNSPRYWIRAMDFIPYFYNERDGAKPSTQLKTLLFPSEISAHVSVALLNSSLFYWWFLVLSDCRHLNLREIEYFPAGLKTMDESITEALSQLTHALMLDYKTNAVRKTTKYQTTGRVEYDEFYPRLSKPIIDEIDRVLAQHYGFTEEELDFIINYDIKYRMGKDADNDSDED